VYHANAFDLAMMIPYFMSFSFWRLRPPPLLAVYDYFVYSKNIPPAPPPVTNWPRVTVQLPIFNERYVIERLVEAVSLFDYPPELLDVQVLDDSTDETCEVARACRRAPRRTGHAIVYIHRSNREGYKAGALENGLKTSKANSSPFSTPIFSPNPIFFAARFLIS